MQTSAHRTYLATEVMTATPQKLQLMLIEAAIRCAKQAQLFWDQGKSQEAGNSIIQCQRIIGEILGGLRVDRDPPLIRRVASIYTFILRSLSTAHVKRQRSAIDDVLRVLEIERGTWKQVCEQLGSRRDVPNAPAEFESSTASFTA